MVKRRGKVGECLKIIWEINDGKIMSWAREKIIDYRECVKRKSKYIYIYIYIYIWLSDDVAQMKHNNNKYYALGFRYI